MSNLAICWSIINQGDAWGGKESTQVHRQDQVDSSESARAIGEKQGKYNFAMTSIELIVNSILGAKTSSISIKNECKGQPRNWRHLDTNHLKSLNRPKTMHSNWIYLLTCGMYSMVNVENLRLYESFLLEGEEENKYYLKLKILHQMH